MDLPPMDHYFFDRSVIAVEVCVEKPPQRPEMPERFFDWRLRSTTTITPNTGFLTFEGAVPIVTAS